MRATVHQGCATVRWGCATHKQGCATLLQGCASLQFKNSSFFKTGVRERAPGRKGKRLYRKRESCSMNSGDLYFQSSSWCQLDGNVLVPVLALRFIFSFRSRCRCREHFVSPAFVKEKVSLMHFVSAHFVSSTSSAAGTAWSTSACGPTCARV